MTAVLCSSTERSKAANSEKSVPSFASTRISPCAWRSMPDDQSSGSPPGCARFEIEQEKNPLPQIHVGEVAQHLAFVAAVQQSGKYRPLEQVVPPIRIELQHGASEAAEHHLREARVESREQQRHVAELPLECCLPRIDTGNLIVGETGGDGR